MTPAEIKEECERVWRKRPCAFALYRTCWKPETSTLGAMPSDRLVAVRGRKVVNTARKARSVTAPRRRRTT